MESVAQCAQHSAGPAHQLFSLLLQTIIQAQCSISPPEKWPKDYGPTALEKGKFPYCEILEKKNLIFFFILI